MKRLLPACLLVCALSGAAGAVEFDFRNDVALYTALDNQAGPVSFTNGSIVAAFTASNGSMNRTASGFGLNSTIPGDDTDAFDTGEWIDITFESNITLTHVGVSSWSLANGDQTTIYVNGVSNGVITSTGDHAFNMSVPTGQVLRVSSTAGSVGNGWSLDSIAVQSGTITPSNKPPVLDPIGNKSLTVSNALNFTITASDIDLDPIVLSASNLPPGAVFNTATNTGSVTGQFTWASAEPVGVYTSQFYITDGTTNDFETITITVTNPPPPPPLTGAVWNVVYNEPQQSGSATLWPKQYLIRDALVERIDALQSGNSATLATFTFSAEEGAGTLMNAMDSALDRGAAIDFIADGDINIGTVYGGTHSLLDLATRPVNPLNLVVDGSTSGIMHDKLGLFDYGGSNQWVFTASWNFTLSASANQWNIALEARSPSLYSMYMSEAAELLAGRFHDDPVKSHAHDGATFLLDESWGTNFIRFAPYPDDTEGGNNAESDIITQIDQAQSNIVFALNKLNRKPIRDALIAAAGRGVDIQGVMPKSDTDPGGVSEAVHNALTNHVEFLPAYAKADYSELDSGELNLIHAKYMVIDPDGTHAVVIHGSANWTTEALVNDNDNDENVVFLRHNDIAAQFHEHFQRITGSGLFNGGNSTLVEWNFNDEDRIADGGISANETQTVARIPAPGSYTFTDGNKLSANGWNGGAGTKYWEASFSTEQHSGIKVSSRQTSTSTGPAHFKVQYKIGAGGTYTDVTNGTLIVDSGWNGQLTRLPLPAACDDQSEVFLRWLMTRNTGVNESSVGSSGASRIDDIFITGTAFDLPPVLDPIENSTVFEEEDLSFTVTASDPVDEDPITLTATNLPTGAAFAEGLFSWSHAAPAGAYEVTFHASDKDGSDRDTVTLTVVKKPLLLISEVADPSGTGGDAYRFVELYNAGIHAIDLAADGWFLSKQVNGGISWSDIELTGTVAAASAWVIANNAADFQDAYGVAPDQENGSVSGNGDDAYFLYYGGNHTAGILMDVYGEPDTDGTDSAWDYEDSRAGRNHDILRPNSNWTASEWTITAEATLGDMTPGAHGPTPEFEDLNDEFVFLGDDLALTVTAINTVRTDVITLSAAALPAAEASFPPVTGADRVSSLLSWTTPPAGTYTATFDAAGNAGTETGTITITVASTSRIDGNFYGWKYGSIVKLINGQFWRNTGGVGAIIDPPLNRPDVTVTQAFGSRRMFVEDVSGYKTVERIAIDESTVTHTFGGLHNGTVYELSDGTRWEQTSFENTPSSADPVTAWRWIENGDTMLRFLDHNEIVIGTCGVEPAGEPVNAPIVSEIDGWFRGWKNKRVFALANGQFWQQVDLDNSTETLFHPNVTLTNWLQSGLWRMRVDEAATPPIWVRVEQLSGVTRTTIDGWFHGFGLRNIFHLADGSWWQQTSLDTSASTRLRPEILIWSEGGTQTLEMPDEGRTVVARELAVLAESTLTNDFSGLYYGNEYQLLNGESWLQISFENVPFPEHLPAAMLWTDHTKTNLLVRSDLDEAIGTCTVVDPDADMDGDQMSNANEVVAGSDPVDQQSRFEITETARDSAGRAILKWNAIEDRFYTIEWTPSLAESFQPIENNIAWPQSSWIDTVHPVEPKGFYRIRVRRE